MTFVRGIAVSGVLLAWLVAALPASAQEDAHPDLAEALEAYRAGELDSAVALFERALEAPGNGPDELVQIHLHVGILRASLGEIDAAERAFEIALALDPALEVPAVLAPGQQASFDAARAARGGARLELHARPAPTSSDRPGASIEIAVANAPEDLVAGYLVRSRALSAGEPRWSTRVDAPSRPIAVPLEEFHGERALELEIDALDAHGGVLARGETSVPRPAIAPVVALEHPSTAAVAGPTAHATAVATASPLEHDDGGILASPWLWIALGALVLGGVTTGVILGTAEDHYLVGAPVGP